MRSRFIQSPFFLSITIGIPFCIFKILFGTLAIRVGNFTNSSILTIFGYIIILWSFIDLFMNTTRALFDLVGASSFIEFCSLAHIGRACNAPNVFLATDTLITFLIICFVLWSGWITHLTRLESYFWYFATTLNLISLSLAGLYTEILRLRENTE